jgi:Mg2+/Co2+ transporter CorC
MFARRNPEMAERFREALRNAKDREAMLAASRDMLEEIEKIAGHERADSISERIAMLLPQHQPA